MDAQPQKTPAELLADFERETRLLSLKAAEENRKKKPKANTAPVDDDFIEDTVIAPPKPTEAMFYGFVGELARIAATGTEINPVGAALACLSFLGANVGRDTFFMEGNTAHHARLFTLHVGRTKQGRKGASIQLTKRVMERIHATHTGLLGGLHTGGLSSREGLASLAPDGNTDSKGTDDKRIWVIETEFANVLQQARREGNTLSTGMRELFDGNDINPATKNQKVRCTKPHFGLHANITPAEFRLLFRHNDVSNGFLNRILIIFAERKYPLVASPKQTPEVIINGLADQSVEIIQFAKGGYPASLNGLEMHLSETARMLYESIYVTLESAHESDFIHELTGRSSQQVLRLAMLFAITDKTRVIEPRHLEAGFAWVKYSIASVKYVFPDQSVSTQARETRTHADKILAFLGKHPNGAGLREISVDCFKRNLNSDKIQKALMYLLTENPQPIEQIDTENGARGRPKKVYLLKTATNKTNKIQPIEKERLTRIV